MNRRLCLFIILVAFLSTGFSACVALRLGQRTDVTVHSVHSLDFSGKATIVGVVVDSDGEFVPGGSVAIFDVDTESLKNEAEVQPDGTYRMVDITPNKYRIRAKADGFTTVQLNDLNLRTNTLVIVDFQLKAKK